MADITDFPYGDYIKGTSENDNITTLYHNNLPHRFIDGLGGDDLMVINSWSFSREHPIYSHLPEGQGGDRIDGGAGNDTIYGSEGENDIVGNVGNDLIHAGTPVYEPPFDTPFFERELDDVVRGGAGNDQMFGQGGHDKLFGDDGNDLADGGAGNDTLSGGNGQDSLRGDAGNDQLNGDAGFDLLSGDAGKDTLNGGAGNDTLNGGAGHDRLLGGAGRDQLESGLGKDWLSGGGGADQFVFSSKMDTGTTAKARDVISDFKKGQDDHIYLKAIDANSKAEGNQAFKFIGDDDFSGAARQLRYDHVKNFTLVSADLNGDKVPDFTIEVSGQINFSAQDFFL